ncbi:MAG: lipolytic protein family [Rhodospirillales bacterium]|nr:lipolytic protein family [Rhodospirillales bacterium]
MSLVMRAVLVAALLVAGTAMAATPPGAVIVLGDSFSDVGNVARFSDGPIWAERVAAAYSLRLQPSIEDGTDFAVGGARLARDAATDLLGQTDLLLVRFKERLPADALVLIWAGGNDVRAASAVPDQAGRERLMRQAADVLLRIVERLARAGARTIVVPTLPDIGHTPEARATDGEWPDAARMLGRAFDARVTAGLARIARSTGARLVRPDVFALLEQVWAEPDRFGIRELIVPCRSSGDDCATHLFWDPVHPTSTLHARIAELVLASLAQP